MFLCICPTFLPVMRIKETCIPALEFVMLVSYSCDLYIRKYNTCSNVSVVVVESISVVQHVFKVRCLVLFYID